MPAQPAETSRTKILYLLLGVTIIAQIDRNAMSMLIEPIGDEFLLSDFERGFLLGPAFVIFFALFGIPFGMWADRGNRRNIISLAMTVWSLLTIACGMAVGFISMALARMGVAIGEAGSNPPAYSMITDLYEEHERGTATGIYSMGPALGIMIGFSAAGLLTATIGWRGAFFVFGVPGILLALYIYFFSTEPERTATAEQAEEEVKFPPLFSTLKLMLGQKTMRHLLAAGALAAFVGIGFSNWLPPYFDWAFPEISVITVGISLGLLIGIVNGGGTFLGGYISDRLGIKDVRWRLWSICIAIFLGWPIGVGAFLADNYWLVLAFIALPAFVALFHLASLFMLVQQLVDVRMRATAIAVLLLTNNLIGGMGPAYVGQVSDMLEPSLGVDSIKWGLASLVLFAFWAAIHFFLASRHLKEDLARVQARGAGGP